MRKYIAVILLGLGLALGQQATATAAYSGSMSYTEFQQINDAESQANVQANCNCTGVVTNTWVGSDGHNKKFVDYHATGPNCTVYAGTGCLASVDYRQRDDGSWHVNGAMEWCNDFGCTAYTPNP